MLKNLKEKIIRRINGEINYYRKQGVKIGTNCSILGNVYFGSEPYLINIGDNVRITDGVRFITHDGGVHVLRNKYNLPNIDKVGKIVIGNNVFIGTQSIIMPGVTIGNNVVIGAGSIVTKNINDDCVAAGVPAKVITDISSYFEKNKEKFIETKQMSYEEKKKYILSKL